jgi:TonB family protein
MDRALIVFICASTAGAQNFLAFSDQANSTYGARGEGVLPPVALMQCRQPEYTEEARIAHLAGVVTVSLTVDDDGVPTDIHVVSPVGLGLDENAVTCMRQSRYSPAQKDGKPVPLKINVSLPFQEHWDGDWHLGAAAFRTVDGATRPILVKAKFPAPAGDHRSLTVCLHLTIGKDGAPRDIQAASPQDAKLDKEAIAIVCDWRFRPGTRNRLPVDVPATLTLVHGAANHVVAGSHLPQ